MPLFMRLNRANFTWDSDVLGAMFGMPMFGYLLLRSKKAHANGYVTWKGRNYAVGARNISTAVNMPSTEPILIGKNQKLRTGS
jgi:hypothetical protein